MFTGYRFSGVVLQSLMIVYFHHRIRHGLTEPHRSSSTDSETLSHQVVVWGEDLRALWRLWGGWE